MKYIIWNPSKTDGAENLEQLHAFEKRTDGCMSSEIDAFSENHVKVLIESIYNETDQELCFAQKPTVNKVTDRDLTLTMPNGCIIARNVDSIETAGSRIRAAFDFVDGIDLDWAEIQDTQSDVSVSI
jgi:hypothetical protein